MYELYNSVSNNDNETTGHLDCMHHSPSNYPVSIVGSDRLSTKQLILAIIDPLIGKWPIVVKGLGSYRQTGRDGSLRSAWTLIGRKEVSMKWCNVLFIGM